MMEPTDELEGALQNVVGVPSPEFLLLKIQHLTEIVKVHRGYQKDQVDKAYAELSAKLHEMNKFREENREQASHYAAAATLDDRTRELHLKIDNAEKTCLNRSERVELKIEGVEKVITPNLGPRVAALEIAKSNLDGRFWALAAIVVVVTLLLQALPFLVKHTP